MHEVLDKRLALFSLVVGAPQRKSLQRRRSAPETIMIGAACAEPNAICLPLIAASLVTRSGSTGGDYDS
jgi:hypothetical protein